jgi:hypothetical protein
VQVVAVQVTEKMLVTVALAAEVAVLHRQILAVQVVVVQ